MEGIIFVVEYKYLVTQKTTEHFATLVRSQIEFSRPPRESINLQALAVELLLDLFSYLFICSLYLFIYLFI